MKKAPVRTATKAPDKAQFTTTSALAEIASVLK